MGRSQESGVRSRESVNHHIAKDCHSERSRRTPTGQGSAYLPQGIPLRMHEANSLRRRVKLPANSRSLDFVGPSAVRMSQLHSG